MTLPDGSSEPFVRAAGARPILRIGRMLAVVPSDGPSRKAWRKLGFVLTEPFTFMECTAFDLLLTGGGVRFLAPPRKRSAATPLAAAIDERLERGSGLFGWTWACQSLYRSRASIEAAEGVEFAKAQDGSKTLLVPQALTPGATTLLELLVHERPLSHPNGADALARILLTVGDSNRVAAMYERVFGLHARRQDRTERRCAVLESGTIGGPKLEIVGSTDQQHTASNGYPWGLVFHSKDLDATVRFLAASGVDCGKPVPSAEGGRVAALPLQLGGISLAFAGE